MKKCFILKISTYLLGEWIHTLFILKTCQWIPRMVILNCIQILNSFRIDSIISLVIWICSFQNHVVVESCVLMNVFLEGTSLGQQPCDLRHQKSTRFVTNNAIYVSEKVYRQKSTRFMATM